MLPVHRSTGQIPENLFCYWASASEHIECQGFELPPSTIHIMIRCELFLLCYPRGHYRIPIWGVIEISVGFVRCNAGDIKLEGIAITGKIQNAQI